MLLYACTERLTLLPVRVGGLVAVDHSGFVLPRGMGGGMQRARVVWADVVGKGAAVRCVGWMWILRAG